METLTKSDQPTQVVYTVVRGNQTITLTVQKSSDGSLSYSGMVVESSPASVSWQDFCTNLEASYSVVNV